MRALILCAGKGERLRPLTDHTPKPLIEVGGKPLLVWHLEHLARAGFHEVVINQGHLGEQLPELVGDGSRWGLSVQYSNEMDYPEPLETGGGIVKALPLLGKGAFLVVNGDTWCDFPLRRLRSLHCHGAHLVMVDNPDHNPDGDFHLAGGRLSEQGQPRLTFSGLAVYQPGLFEGCSAERHSVVPLLRRAMGQGLVTGEHYRGRWYDSGTPERLASLREALA